MTKSNRSAVKVLAILLVILGMVALIPVLRIIAGFGLLLVAAVLIIGVILHGKQKQ